MDDALEQPFPRPLSDQSVASLPNGLVPARNPLVGRHVQLEPLNSAAHASELYKAGHGSEVALRIWEYLPFGPWRDEASFVASLQTRAFDAAGVARRSLSEMMGQRSPSLRASAPLGPDALKV